MRFHYGKAVLIVVGLLVLAVLLFQVRRTRTSAKMRDGGSSTQITQPAQQHNDLPGGNKYPHAGLTQHIYGSGNEQYWIFEPADPTPTSAPVIIFNHGWGAMDPATYGAWIEHLVKRGNIVIYPRYQEDLRTATASFTHNALAAVKAALQELKTGHGHVKPELDNFAIVGHSVGGLLTANLAALVQGSGLPKPKAVMSVEPGKTWTISERSRVPLADLSKVPSDALLLVVVGQDDKLVGDVDGKKIFTQTSQIPLRNKDFVIAVSDDHGVPSIVANHLAPTAQGALIKKVQSEPARNTASQQSLRDRIAQRVQERRADSKSEQNNVSAENDAVNALDYNGYWKLFDGLTDAAFYSKNRQYALGNTPEQTSLGKWNDGVAIKPLQVTKKP